MGSGECQGERLLGPMQPSRPGGRVSLDWVVGHASLWFERRLFCVTCARCLGWVRCMIPGAEGGAVAIHSVLAVTGSIFLSDCALSGVGFLCRRWEP